MAEVKRLYVTSDEEVADALVARGIGAAFWGQKWRDLCSKARELKEFQGEIILLVPPTELRMAMALLRSLPPNVAVAVPAGEDLRVGPGFTKLGPTELLPDLFDAKFVLIRRGNLRLADLLKS